MRGTQLRDRSGFGIEDAQRAACGIGKELDVGAVVVLVRRVPHIGTALTWLGAPGSSEDLAFEDGQRLVPVTQFAQHLLQLRGLGGEYVDAFVYVTIGGGQADGMVAGQGIGTAAVTEPAQDHHRLTERGKCTRAAWGADGAAVGGQQASQVGDHRAGNIEHGRIGNQREASASVDAVLCREPSYQGLHGCLESEGALTASPPLH